jgi:hypothetical protein
MRFRLKWRISLGAAFAVMLAASTTVALAQGTTRSVGSHDATKVRDVSFELVGQVQSSAPGVSPATSIQYGYLSDLGGLPIFKTQPQNESTALFTFYTDTTTSRVIDNGPIRVINREGTMTIYSDPTTNGSFANPDSFRDGTPVLVARLRQQVIVDTATGGFTAQNLNTIISTSPFQGPNGTLQLGKTGDRFRTIITGHLNAPGPPSAYIAGYTQPVGDLPKY